MSVSPVYLLGVVLASIALLILLINWRAKMHPFMALMVVSVLAALAAGIPASEVPKTLAEGAGGVLGETGIVVFLGAMLGRLLSDTGPSPGLPTSSSHTVGPRQHRGWSRGSRS